MGQRLIAVVMILGSSVLTGWVSGDIAFPAILGMLGLLGVQRWFTWDIRPERHFVTPLLLLLLAVLFAFHCHYAHVRADQAAAFAWQTIARYFLASMILILFLRPRRTEDRRQRMGPFSVLHPPVSNLPPSLGLFHLASVMAAGQVLLLDDQYVAFRLLELFSVTLVLLYAMAGPLAAGGEMPARWGLTPRIRSWVISWLPLSLLLLIAVNLGWIGGSLLFRHVEVINFLPGWLSRGGATLETTSGQTARVGFTASGELSTILAIKEDADSSPALTITGSNPTYLRARAFESYRQGSWYELVGVDGVPAEQNAPLGMLLGRTSRYRVNDAEASREMTVRHESALGDCLFTPLGTCYVDAPFSSVVERNEDDIIKSHNVRLRQSYTVGFTTGASGRPPVSLQWHHLVELPRQLHPEIRQKAARLFAPCTTTAEKIEAVTQYFHTNFTYLLGLEVPEGQDPLDYFLRKASTGYCEYFASGAVILLRLGDVPTRYVTGFLVTERGQDGRSWIARNMDAHAWAEAWDKERGQWVIVEATTQEGLDDTSLADELVRSAGSRRPFLTQLVQSLYDYGLFGVIGQFFVSYGLPTGLGLCVVFLGAAGWVAARRRRHAGGFANRSLSAHVLVLHRLLAAMDRKTRSLGYRRQSGETLHAFAARLGHACSPLSAGDGQLPAENWLADWYLRYADLRYGSAADPVRIEQLHQEAQKRREHPSPT